MYIRDRYTLTIIGGIFNRVQLSMNIIYKIYISRIREHEMFFNQNSIIREKAFVIYFVFLFFILEKPINTSIT